MDIKSLSLEEMEPLLMELGLKKFQVKEVFSWLHQKQVESFDEMTNISKAGREALDKKFYINFLKITKKLVSSLDGTIKYLYELRDGQMVESVLMHYQHGNSLCISTQAGCRMGCKFCASTLAGLARNLTLRRCSMKSIPPRGIRGKGEQRGAHGDWRAAGQL